MGKVNQERLAEYLGELKRKEDTNDRYVAALRGETLTRKPYVRIQPIPKENITEADKDTKIDKAQKKCYAMVRHLACLYSFVDGVVYGTFERPPPELSSSEQPETASDSLSTYWTVGHLRAAFPTSL
ncbi:hypothetical protein JRO89_XS08G0024100 [Xanthoceras sorbifolium]|uniref:Uncharacterized protein n=1 Tax=Xanthoceras sorbifolium TaxID=99658 RepID=A0ABQ8HNA7_9ROSI|nr:hypothetical protein JRO89_XS08G0024100 [Xanthoceras sorbifolium]